MGFGFLLRKNKEDLEMIRFNNDYNHGLTLRF